MIDAAIAAEPDVALLAGWQVGAAGIPVIVVDCNARARAGWTDPPAVQSGGVLHPAAIRK
ncbi:hypothetical protein Q9299_16105 [Gemmobacter fulvus]|uniref:hypothetical protein n=1 Tax=Gemmobacter fulvus TaxID=2840474 RepID=UPI001C000183|nr:hypothetical protein [Gemmobacter fulvus]MBT9246383.1 hypothetical protein [Gemmobacter fulvus]MDQ1849817.1 hypothetical protein [Gemmobacter fulvus]